MKSLIRLLLNEAAEEVLLPAEPSATNPAQPVGAPMSPNDFTPPPQTTAMPGGFGTNMGSFAGMPEAPAIGATSTIQKTVVNKELILAVTAELKSLINVYEKKFESEDLTPEVSNVYLKSFLDGLAFQANKIAEYAGISEEPSEEPLAEEPALSEVPPPAVPPTAPAPTEEPVGEALPAAEKEPAPIAEEEPFGNYTAPGGEFEASPYTNPTEAI